jgi:hypothetical protein
LMQKKNTMKKFKLKNLSILLFFCLLATTLGACKSTSVVPPTTIETTNTVTKTEVIRDTAFTIPKDSSYYKAYLECANGKVVFSPKAKPESKKGKHLNPPKVNIRDNIITVDCQAEAQELFAKWKDVYVKEHQQITKKIPFPVPAELSWWQNTQIILGRIFLGIIILLATVVVLRLTKTI